jgi:uncharacterized SAM-binding protein YcdF (DUF218 family)
MKKICYILLGLLIIWFLGFIYFIYSIPTEVGDSSIRTEAVVVLTGGRKRLAEGFKILDQQQADKLFISGVDRNVRMNELLNLYLQSPNKPNVELGKEAFDTIGNAQETKSWIIKNNIKSIRLVTANYHMPRSLFEFKQILPNLIIIPNPVMLDYIKVKDWWHNQDTAVLLFKEYNKYLISRLIIIL